MPFVAIVGQPNSGKSTLLNKIVRQRLALTSKVAGTTRDRQYADTTWNGCDFTMVDTAGISYDGESQLEPLLNAQIDIALSEADVILFVVDGKENLQSLDPKVVKKFRTSKKPVVLAVNKLDSPNHMTELASVFNKTGIKDIVPISAITGRGVGDLLDVLTDHLKTQGLGGENLEEKITGEIRVSLIGKPNVGKSSLFNAIAGSERSVVSDIPGTTRAAVDTQVTIKGDVYTFVDTAGLKKKSLGLIEPDLFASFQTFKALRASDIALFVIDAASEITHQDKKLAGLVTEMDKGCVILANKSDLYKEDEQKLRDYISYNFPNLKTSPVFFVSAKTGEGLDEALAAIKPIWEARHFMATQEQLRDVLHAAMEANPPKRLRDQKMPKVHNLKQFVTNPPKFELAVNDPGAISEMFRHALIKVIIDKLDLYGTPVKLSVIQAGMGTSLNQKDLPK